MNDNWLDSKIPPSPCPYCDASFDRAGSPDGGIPEPGDYSVCIRCASLLKFGENMELLPVSQEEINACSKLDPTFMDNMKAMQNAVRNVDRRPDHERK